MPGLTSLAPDDPLTVALTGHIDAIQHGPELAAVQIRADLRGPAGYCFPVARSVAAQFGGQAAYGWRLVRLGNVFAFAEHHAVWRTVEDELVDVVPLYPDAPSDPTTFIHDGRFGPADTPTAPPTSELSLQLRRTQLVGQYLDDRVRCADCQTAVRRLMRRQGLPWWIERDSDQFQSAILANPAFHAAFRLMEEAEADAALGFGRILDGMIRRGEG